MTSYINQSNLVYLRFMSSQIWMFFLVLTSCTSALCQFSLDFSNADRGLNADWTGDLELFGVEEQRLRLMDRQGGRAVLAHPVSWSEGMSFEIDLELDFAPSGANGIDIYLWSQEEQLSVFDAYYLHIGESGSEDALMLYQRIDGSEDILAIAKIGAVATAPVRLSLRVDYLDGQWIIYTDYTGRRLYVEELRVSVDDDVSIISGFLGIECQYTSTRSDRFYFDDLYFGEMRVDTMGPQIIQSDLLSNKLNIIWDEYIQLTDQSLVTIDPLVDFELDQSDDSLSIRLNEELIYGQSYVVSLSRIADWYGNLSDTTLTFLVPFVPDFGDILINEILFNPTDDGADYIELKNVSDNPYSLIGWSLSNTDNNQERNINLSEMLAPGELICLTEDIDDIVDRYPFGDPARMRDTDIPPMNNGSGYIVLSYGDIIIDEVAYDEDDHHVSLDDVEGVSLQRLSGVPGRYWASSSAIDDYGTPGAENGIPLDWERQPLTLELLTPVISPDGDGYQDELEIDYVMDELDYLVRLNIYDDRGQLMIDLLNNEIVGGQGSWTWKGDNHDGDVLPAGIYVALVQLLSPESGSTHREKFTFVIAKNLD